MTVYELCERDVVNVTTGQNLGKVDDISFEPETASITGVILYGRLKLFGLLGYYQVNDERLASAPGRLTGVIGAAPAPMDV